jgi:hypothetical protein
MKSLSAAVGALLVFGTFGRRLCPGTEDAIPFPQALDSAAVVESRITDIRREALVLGNGDLNALLWERGGSLCMRVTKNDIWDARIDTSGDPDLMTMDIQSRTWKGGAKRVPSWHGTPYPVPRCAAAVVIGQPNASRSIAGPWRCIRAGKENDWAFRDGSAVMSVKGAAGVSAGYGCSIRGVSPGAAGHLKLRLSGTANARYFVDMDDSRGKSLVHSGWIDAPADESEASFPLPAGRTVANLDLYVWSKDGARAEVRHHQVWFETGDGTRQTVDLAALDTGNWTARLDLRRAVATLGDNGATPTIVRCLADRNLFLVDGPGEVSLEEVKASYLPAAEQGVTDGVKWLRMKMPGDVDYKGMEYALAVAVRGSTKAVSLVTSYDTEKDVLQAAISAAREAAAVEPVKLIRAHDAVWAAFWSASGLELGDRFFQDAWYRNMYYMRCFCRAGTTMPITLYAGLATDKPGWHGAPTLDYNIQQVFWPMLSCNQVDLMEPYVRFIAGFAPRARWLAKQTYGLEGLFLPVNIFGPEYLVPPEEAKSKNARQIAYVPWTYGFGLTGWGLQNLWLRYKYQPDPDYLLSVYPLFRDGAEFYANIIDQCKDDDGDGKVEIGPSYNPEHGPFGCFNSPVDIAYFHFLLNAASEAARILERDDKLVSRWQKAEALVPNYETALLNGVQIVANWRGAAADAVKVHNVASPTVPVFPGDRITWFSPQERKALFERTLRWIKHNGNNSHIMVNVARARFSMPEAYAETRAHFSRIATPNGIYAAWPGHGSYLAESWAFAGLVAEFLMQSVDDPSTGSGHGIIRLFPAWPKEHDAEFADLRAQGGFLVSAEQKDGEVVKFTVTSTVGGTLRLQSPWGAVRANGKALTPDARGIVTLDTRPDEQVVFKRK